MSWVSEWTWIPKYVTSIITFPPETDWPVEKANRRVIDETPTIKSRNCNHKSSLINMYQSKQEEAVKKEDGWRMPRYSRCKKSLSDTSKSPNQQFWTQITILKLHVMKLSGCLKIWKAINHGWDSRPAGKQGLPIDYAVWTHQTIHLDLKRF